MSTDTKATPETTYWNDGTELLTLGDRRVTIVLEPHPTAPEFDYGCPVLPIGTGWHRAEGLGDVEYGEDSERHDGIPHGIVEVYARMYDLAQRIVSWDDATSLTDRYLRIFHGGSATTISSTVHRGGDDYLVYDTRAMREHWGQTGEMLETSDPSAEEWQAYIDGEVYCLVTEELNDDAARERREALTLAVDDATGRMMAGAALGRIVASVMALDGTPERTWVETETVGGYYGSDVAHEEALSILGA